VVMVLPRRGIFEVFVNGNTVVNSSNDIGNFERVILLRESRKNNWIFSAHVSSARKETS